jgi:lipid-A-disaccharide synthase
VLAWLDDPARSRSVQERFLELHHSLRRNTARAASDAIAQVLESR